jgi:dihydrodiol dehydrogenase / D-xylose 1-dehydrogenase (NADP)
MKTINWGIIGPGGIAHKFADAIKSVENARLIACASKDMDKANAFKEKYDLQYAYNSYDELVKNNEVDAVYIATTHNFHYENAMLCLNNGKAVLVEKAFTINAKQAEELVNLANKKGLFVMEAMWTRYLPLSCWVREQIKNGEIGEACHIDASFGVKFAFDKNSRAFNINLAGGGLLDLGIYPLSYTSMIFGCKPLKISSVAKIGETGVDEQAAISLLYKNGKTASITYSMHCNYSNSAIICGTKGKIILPEYIWGKSGKLIKEDKSITEFSEGNENGFIYEIKEATELIINGKIENPALPHEEIIGIMKICDALRESWSFKYPCE